MVLSILDGVKRCPRVALWGVFAVCLCVVSVCLYLYRSSEHTSVNVGSASVGSDLPAGDLQRAVERNTRESQGRIPAAVRSVGAPIEVAQGVAEDRASEDRVAPEGYTYLALAEVMTKGRLRADERKAVFTDRGERGDWLGSPGAVYEVLRLAEEAQRDWAFGWIELSGATRRSEVALQLAEKRVEVLASSGKLLRTRLPADVHTLQEIEALPGIEGLGVLPSDRKLDQELAANEAQYAMRDQVPVFITLMSDDDDDGRWRAALEDKGAEVGRFDQATRAYSANVFYGEVEAIAAADFVLSIEQERLIEPMLASAVSVMGADGVRMYGGKPGLFGGITGASVPVGVLDTGLNILHTDIATHRSSVCGVSLSAIGSQDLWYDQGIHGTHVTGIVAGNGYAEAKNAGVAPGVRHIRFGRVFGGFSSTLLNAMEGLDYMAGASSCLQNGRESAAVKPLVVNMSFGALAGPFPTPGRGIIERKLDAVVWNAHHLHTISAANAGEFGINVLSVAKNVLSVGATVDDGTIAEYSSHGGRGSGVQGRLKPNVVTVGTDVYSALGRGSKGEYIALSGTSMSSPAMAGMAALMMDAAPDLKNNPAMMRAYLMASAIRPDVWLDNPAWFPLNNTHGIGVIQEEYGMGSVSARLGVLNRDSADGWITGHASVVLTDGEYGYVDVTVPAGAERLDVVMTWDEPPAESVGNVVLNDLDLWIDEHADCPDAACGEHGSLSLTDNVEWVIVRTPPAGVYRVKAVGGIYTDEARVGMAWKIIRGPAAPTINLAVDQTVLEGQGTHELVATLTVDGYVATGVDLHVNCRASDGRSVCNGLDYDAGDPHPSPPWYRHALVSREDGTLASSSGSTMYLGELAAGETQQVKMYFYYDGDDDNARITLTASAWNARAGGVASVLLRRSGSTAPMPPEWEVPSNTDFLAAKVLEGLAGSELVDLAPATSEAGESELMMDPNQFFYDPPRPRGSMWYAWTASESRFAVFRIEQPTGLEDPPQTLIDAFQATGDGNDHSLARLQVVAFDNEGGVVFHAKADRTYYLRVGDRGSSVPVTLTWDKAERPVNDGWQHAAVLEGREGSMAGNTNGATLEYGEWPWGMTATVWYRWTAPSDGAWMFDAVRHGDTQDQTEHYVLVHTGEDVSSLRTVSDFRNVEIPLAFPAVVHAARGQTYHISVGSPFPELGSNPGAFDLIWEQVDSDDLEDESGVTNDHHGHAVSLGDGMTGSRAIYLNFDAPSPILTVEPDEPEAAGVFTRWYRWTAPETGRFTWQIRDPGTYGDSHYRVAIFEGDSLSNLDFVGSTAATPDETNDLFKFVVRMDEGKHYMISVGFPPRDAEVVLAGVRLGPYRDVLSWGSTPENDDFDDAIALHGAQGSVTFTTSWATVDAGEQVTSSASFNTPESIWYTYEVNESGWYEFFIPGVSPLYTSLAVYRAVGDGGVNALQTVVMSYRNFGQGNQTAHVKFYAEAGAEYILRIAHGRNSNTQGRYDLRWRETKAPVWIKYLGYVPNSGMDMQGSPVSFSRIVDMSFNTRGDALYAATDHAVVVYKRDVKTGALTLAGSHNYDSPRRFLGWDAYRTRLLTYCTEWQEMVPEDYANLRLKAGKHYSSGVDRQDCSETVEVLVDASDPDDQLLHHVHRSGVDLFRIQAAGHLQHLGSFVSENLALVDAALSPQSGYLYGANLDSLVIFKRDPETSELTLIDVGYNLRYLHALSISGDGKYLFSVEDDGKPYSTIKVFDLSNPEEPALVQTLTDIHYGFIGFGQCQVSDFRNGKYAAEFFCNSSRFVMEYHPGANPGGNIVLTDIAVTGERTRYNNMVPLGTATVVKASPDGGHIYTVSGDYLERPGIHVFERVGNTIEAPEEVDKTTRFRLDLFEVESDTVQFGAFYASGGDCIHFRKATFKNVSYSIVSSRWQERGNADAPWMDIAGTEVESQLCSYRPDGDAEYRLAADITVDSVTGRYASNILDL